MDKLLEGRAYILKFYARYSRCVDAALKFVLAFMTFSFVNNHVGYFETLTNPLIAIGLSVICIFLPQSMTALFGALMIIIQNIHAFNCRSEDKSSFTISIASPDSPQRPITALINTSFLDKSLFNVVIANF